MGLDSKIDRATWPFLKFDKGRPSDNRQGLKHYNDRGHGYFLKSTGDMGINKVQRHATWAFLKFDTESCPPPPPPHLDPKN